MIRLFKLSAALLVAAAFFYGSVFAQIASAPTTLRSDVPHTFSYQGQITSSDGSTLSGAHLITATLYSDKFGKGVVWQGSYTSEIKNGIFNISIGSGNFQFPSTLDLNRPLWVGVKIDGGVEMQPFTELMAAPYALNVPDKSITAAKLADDVILGSANSTTPQIDPNDWDRTGNPWAAPADFVGTAGFGSGDLELRAQNVKVVHYTANAGIPNINGGAPMNVIAGGITGSTISGGGGVVANSIFSNSGVIGGGQGNVIGQNSPLSTIGGGDLNHIWDNNQHATIAGGGWQNEIGDNTGVVANMSSIGGGAYNHIFTISSTIGGGYLNQIIGSGDVGKLCTISGGGTNMITNGYNSTIGGGAANQEFSKYTTIGGGNVNIIDLFSDFCTIAGGDINHIFPYCDHSIIGGGQGNMINGANFTTIGGGQNSMILNGASYSAVVGGQINVINVNADHSFIGGGKSNNIGASDPFCTIAGGEQNQIFPGIPATGDPADHNTIGGGQQNTIDLGTFPSGAQFGGHQSTIAGGYDNHAFNNFDFIGGGGSNRIFGGTSAIGGGSVNLINGPTLTSLTTPFSDFSDITGGVINTTNGFNNTILGGNDNITDLAVQIAAGYINDNTHNGITPFPVTFADAVNASVLPSPANAITPNALSDCFNAPLFMVGNGNGSFFNRTAPHNAFEVSYNGHSMVADINGTGQPHDQAINPNTPDGRAAIEGATYDDNIVYAWGDIASDGNIVSDFGVLSSKLLVCACTITHMKYLIILNQVLPDNTNTQRVFTDGSVTATLEAPWIDPGNTSVFEECSKWLFASQLHAVQVAGIWHTAFEVTIDQPHTPGDNGAGEIDGRTCASTSGAFMFKVCGRKHVAGTPDQVNDPNTTPRSCGVQP